MHVIFFQQNVDHTVYEDVGNGNRVSGNNHLEQKKLLTGQELEITEIPPPRTRASRMFSLSTHVP